MPNAYAANSVQVAYDDIPIAVIVCIYGQQMFQVQRGK